MKKTIVFLFIIISFLLNAENDFIEKLDNEYLPYHYLNLTEFLNRDNGNRDFQPTDPPAGIVRQTSEFEQMEGVLVRYPLGIPVSAVAEMSEDTKVYTVVSSGSQTSCENQYQNNGVNMANCEFINAPTDSWWIRDYGPWFISHDNQVELVDFPYNRPRPLDDEIPIVVANYLGINYYGMEIETAGGNYMCDGNYIGASTDLIYEENTNLTANQIDQLVLDFLGIQEYLVTLDPLDDYIKHIDCWGKFLDVDKVLIGQVPETDYRYADFEFIANFFENQQTAWGNNFQVFRVYTPGGNPATPYTNSLILNKKVFVPITGSQWDDEAIATYEAAMPGYEIVSVQSGGWYNTDALHCRTRGVADRDMLYILHQPLLGDQDYQDAYTIEAEIIPFSGEALDDNYLLLFYRLDGGNFIPVPLTSSGGNTYSADIPGQPEGTLIEYYIHAEDITGKSSDHPIIGEFEPHDFTVVNQPVPAELVVDPTAITIELPQNTVDVTLLELSNIGGMLLTYSLDEQVDWLTLDPTSGTLVAGSEEDIVLTFDTNDLVAGEYTCDITITDDREETIVPVNLTVSATSVNGSVISNTTELLGNYPNPFNPTTTIKFNLENKAKINLGIYNIKGQKVKTLIDEERKAGLHQISWNGLDDNGNSVSSGVYYTILDIHEEGIDYTSVKKVILLK